MDSTQALERFRQDTLDQADPPLWSNEEVFGYLDDAQNTFCRLTGGLGDATSLATRVMITPDSDWVDLSPKILKIRLAENIATGRPVEILNREDMQQRKWYFTPHTGPLRALVIGMEAHKARCYPYPAINMQLALLIDRLPLKAITDDDQKLEIDVQHHPALLLWMKRCAYLKDDEETLDPRKAEKFEQEFYAYCAKAKQEKDRAMHKTRVVAYGGL